MLKAELTREEEEKQSALLGDDDSVQKDALLDFLVARSMGEQQQQASLSPLSCALLSGPPHCGKTSLLLQLAYNLAIDVQSRVVFICKPRNFENDYIYLSQGLATSSAVFDRVHIKYIEDDEELRKYFAAFHLHLELPTGVIVDDFVDCFGGWDGHQGAARATRELLMVKTLSLCRSAIDYANEKAGSSAQCKLVISDTHLGDGPRLLYIFKRWLSEVYVTKALDDISEFSLELRDGGGKIQKSNIVVRYILANQVLHFGGLEASSKSEVD